MQSKDLVAAPIDILDLAEERLVRAVHRVQSLPLRSVAQIAALQAKADAEKDMRLAYSVAMDIGIDLGMQAL